MLIQPNRSQKKRRLRKDAGKIRKMYLEKHTQIRLSLPNKYLNEWNALDKKRLPYILNFIINYGLPKIEENKSLRELIAHLLKVEPKIAQHIFEYSQKKPEEQDDANSTEQTKLEGF